jgi:uncharacterized protein YdhG (YjbR/CyaY superfamily)
MTTEQKAPENIDDYIAGFPPDVQAILERVRHIIRDAVPDAQETIKYKIPTFTLKGNLLSFAAYSKHIGVYPLPAGTEKFRQDIAPYRAAKSTARFALNKPIPYDLVGQLAKFRAQEHLDSIAAKAKKK